MKRTVLTIVSGTLILFIWNAFSWMVLPFHEQSMHTIPDEALDTGKLQNQMAADGLYHYPGLPEDGSEGGLEEVKAKLATGPRITMMVYIAGGTPFMDPANFLWNLIFNLLTVLLLWALVNRLANKTLKNILWTTISVGLLVALMSDLPLLNWFMFPLDYILANILDYVVTMTLLGLLFSAYTFKTEA